MTNNKQQTAVEFIQEQLRKYVRYDNRSAVETFDKIFEQAKEMEKERMKGMYVEGSFAKMRYYDGLEYIDAEQYYNETFGGGEQ
jgi:hypothetical protein